MAKKGKEYVCCCTSLDDDVSTHTHTQYIIIRSHHMYNILRRRRCDTCATSTSGRTTQPRTSAQSQASRASRCKSFVSLLHTTLSIVRRSHYNVFRRRRCDDNRPRGVSPAVLGARRILAQSLLMFFLPLNKIDRANSLAAQI